MSPCSESAESTVSSGVSSTAVDSRRRERVWAWLSLAALVLAWDRAARLDERPAPPRVRIAHALSREEAAQVLATARVLTE
jgi:hypothetical protein